MELGVGLRTDMKKTCGKEIGLSAQNMLIILDSKVNIMCGWAGVLGKRTRWKGKEKCVEKEGVCDG